MKAVFNSYATIHFRNLLKYYDVWEEGNGFHYDVFVSNKRPWGSSSTQTLLQEKTVFYLESPDLKLKPLNIPNEQSYPF